MKATPAQWGIFAASAALTVVLLYSFRRVPHAVRQPAPASSAVSAPAGAGHPTTVLSGFDYAQTSAGTPKFRVHADRTVGFAQSAGLPSTWYGLEAVTLTLFSDQGEPFQVKSDTADYDPRTKATHLKRNVVMTDVSGTVIRTANVDYDPASDRLHAPGPVDMLRGQMRGHATSAVYDSRSRELSLSGPVTAEGITGAPNSPFSTLRSDRGTYRRTPGEIELDGNVAGSRGNDRFSADSLRLHLSAANQVDRAWAQGSVSGSVAGTPGQPPQVFAGDAATLDFDAAGKLDRIQLSGAPSKIETAQVSPESGSRTIEARVITLDYESEILKDATAEGDARMDRDLRNPKGEPVHETIRSDSATAAFSSAGGVDSAHFIGNVVATSPAAIAQAPRAVFTASSDSMAFLAERDRDAEVSAPRGKVVARRIDLFSSASRLVAVDSARAFLKPSSENRGLPEFLSSSKKPTRAKADRIELDDAARTATFEGGAALWQESNSLLADHIKLFDADRSASAEGNVRTVARSAASAGEKTDPLTTVTAARMRYSEAKRTAHFEDRVVATRGPQVAQGDAADSRFNEKNQIEGTVLTGHVKFSDPATGRRGSGDRADDEPLARVTTLFGDPAVALDAAGNRISAAVLTFRKDAGSVEAKAKDGQKIDSVYQTKSPPAGRAKGGGR